MTMKTRIIEEINSNGSSTFYPQRKMLFGGVSLKTFLDVM
jgi:hypothetical protein